jgi:dienelactone hydrolase
MHRVRFFGPGKARTLRLPVLVVVLLTAITSVSQVGPSAAFDATKDRGTVVNSVPCLHDARQTYSVYLPSHYTPDRRWPIIYAFDPLARGKVPVALYKDAAEKYGYIVVGSNNAKNGPQAQEIAAAQAVWQDTHKRFSIDRRRVYATGLSGGARFATVFAMYCSTCSIAGVIAHGAGYPAVTAPAANDKFVYYAAVGDADFNYPEILNLRDDKEKQGAPFKAKIYPGPHQWAPKDIVEDAMEWIELKAMQAGTEKPNAEFIHKLFDQTRAEAAQAGERGDVMAQFYALLSLAMDFKGLEDVGEFEKQLAAMRDSKELKKARHEQERVIDLQKSLTGVTGAEIGELGRMPPDVQFRIKQQVLAALLGLRSQASKGKDHLVYARAFNQLWIRGMELGQQHFSSKEFLGAATYFDLMAAAAPDQTWPLLLLAETKVREGDKKAALKAIEEAVKRGMKNARTLTQDPELKPLASDPAFQRIVQGLDQSPGN